MLFGFHVFRCKRLNVGLAVMLAIFNITFGESIIHPGSKYAEYEDYRLKVFEKFRQDIYTESTQSRMPVLDELLVTGANNGLEKDKDDVATDIHSSDDQTTQRYNFYSEPEHASKVHGGIESRHKRQVRLSAISGFNVWPHNIVPYYIDISTYPTGYGQWSIKSAISSGLRYLESVSCVRFIERDEVDAATRARIGHRHSVRVFNGRRCWSHSGCTKCYLGQSNGTSQDLSMSTSCLSNEIVQHEFGHVLGLTHEHTRTDMHKHIAVNFSLVQNPKLFHRKTHPEFINNAPYDLSSIQHYRTSILVTKNPEDMWLKYGIGKLTHYDEWSINAAYCSDNCDRTACKNDGYMTTKSGRCECACPEGLTGATCEQIESEQLYRCGGTLQLTNQRKRLTVQTPNYPNRYSVNTTCVWLVKAPAGNIIQSRIRHIDLPAEPSGCPHYIEIRDKLIGQVAREKCGKCESYNCFVTKSHSNVILIIFNAMMRGDAGSGALIDLSITNDCSQCRGAPCSSGRCYPHTGELTCGFEQGLLGECSKIKIHDSYQKSYEDITWTESAWEIADRVQKLPGYRSVIKSAAGRLHLQSLRPAPLTAGPYEGAFRIVPYLMYPGRSRCLRFWLYLCCDSAVSLRVYSAFRGRLNERPLLTLSHANNRWRAIKLTVEAPPLLTRAEGVEIVFISRHTVSSTEGPAHLGVDGIDWRYGDCL